MYNSWIVLMLMAGRGQESDMALGAVIHIIIVCNPEKEAGPMCTNHVNLSICDREEFTNKTLYHSWLGQEVCVKSLMGRYL